MDFFTTIIYNMGACFVIEVCSGELLFFIDTNMKGNNKHSEE